MARFAVAEMTLRRQLSEEVGVSSTDWLPRGGLDPWSRRGVSIIATRAVHLSHGQKMPRQMLRHTLLFQLLFSLLGADVDVRYLSIQRVREFAGDSIQVC
jgi:hypothetical protein